jgi:hypothetical protein
MAKTIVTCSVDKKLKEAFDKAGLKNFKQFSENAIEEAIFLKIQEVAKKENAINDFINFGK